MNLANCSVVDRKLSSHTNLLGTLAYGLRHSPRASCIKIFEFASTSTGFSRLLPGASSPKGSLLISRSASVKLASRRGIREWGQSSQSPLANSVQATFSFFAACLVCWSSIGAASALTIDLPSTDVSKEQYERAIKSHSSRSNLPSKGEAEMLLQLDKELFTEDAWEGMKT